MWPRCEIVASTKRQRKAIARLNSTWPTRATVDAAYRARLAVPGFKFGPFVVRLLGPLDGQAGYGVEVTDAVSLKYGVWPHGPGALLDVLVEHAVEYMPASAPVADVLGLVVQPLLAELAEAEHARSDTRAVAAVLANIGAADVARAFEVGKPATINVLKRLHRQLVTESTRIPSSARAVADNAVKGVCLWRTLAFNLGTAVQELMPVSAAEIQHIVDHPDMPLPSEMAKFGRIRAGTEPGYSASDALASVTRLRKLGTFKRLPKAEEIQASLAAGALAAGTQWITRAFDTPVFKWALADDNLMSLDVRFLKLLAGAIPTMLRLDTPQVADLVVLLQLPPDMTDPAMLDPTQLFHQWLQRVVIESRELLTDAAYARLRTAYIAYEQARHERLAALSIVAAVPADGGTPSAMFAQRLLETPDAVVLVPVAVKCHINSLAAGLNVVRFDAHQAGAVFDQCVFGALRDVTFDQCVFVQCVFQAVNEVRTGARLGVDRRLPSGSLTDVLFTQCDLAGTVFLPRATLYGVEFNECNLARADFTGMTHVPYRAQTLWQAGRSAIEHVPDIESMHALVFDNCNLKGAVFTDALLVEGSGVHSEGLAIINPYPGLPATAHIVQGDA